MIVVAMAQNSKTNNNNHHRSGSKADMASLTTESSGADSIHDLVPAGLIKSRDGSGVSPKFSKVGESLRKNVPHEMQCSMFCGGKRCKYETSDNWKQDEMAISGIYSHWVTEDLVAMARPNTRLIEKGLIDEFKKLGIKSIFNLQMPGEHASCGPKLDKAGFSYDPNDFMKQDIFFYNFPWKDYSTGTMNGLLDTVKVLSFAISEGKVAVHCHAGLGRTGVLIACYLVYYLRVRANDALRYLRLKRPGSVQTRRQIDCVKEFEAFFLPQCVVFAGLMGSGKKMGSFTIEQFLKKQKAVVHGFEARTLRYIPKIVFCICERLLKLCNGGPVYQNNGNNFTNEFVAYKFDNKGNKLLNFGSGGSADSEGNNNDSLVVTRRSSRSMLLSTDDETSMGLPTPMPAMTRPGSDTAVSYVQSCSSALSGIDDRRLDEILGDGIRNQPLNENSVMKELASHADLRQAAANEVLPKYSADDIYTAFLDDHADKLKRNGEGDFATADNLLYKQYRTDLNYKMSAWDRIDTETNLFVLTALLLEWLEHLRQPILDKDGITYVVIHCDNIDAALKRLPNHVCYILEYLIRFVARLRPLTKDKSENLMCRLMAALTHQCIVIDDKQYPSKMKSFPKLRGGTADSTKKFMMKLFDIVVALQNQQMDRISRYRMSSHFDSLNSSTASAATMSRSANESAIKSGRRQNSLVEKEKLEDIMMQ